VGGERVFTADATFGLIRIWSPPRLQGLSARCQGQVGSRISGLLDEAALSPLALMEDARLPSSSP